MAISYVGGQTTTITTIDPVNTTITFALTGGIASTPAAGDFVLLSYNNGLTTNRDLSAVVTTSGYTLLADLHANDSFDANMAVFTKLMGGTPDSNVVVVGRPGSASVVIVHISVFRGVDASTPLDVTSTTATGIDTGNVDPAAITPITDGNVIAIFGSDGISTTARTFTTGSVAYMSGFMQASGAGSSQGTLSGTGYVTGQPANTSYNPAAWTISADGISNSWAALTVALRASIPPITGTASGTLTISGASVGAATISATSSGALDVAGQSSGVTLISATASGVLDVSGVSVGSVVISAAAAGSYTVSGSATGGTPPITATASGTLTIGGASTGAAIIAASASGSLYEAGVSQGGTVITGTASSTYTVSGRAAEGISRMRYGEIVVTAAYFGDIPVNVIAVGDHVVLEW